MIKLSIADLRDAWSAWLGVMVTFVASGFAFSLVGLLAGGLATTVLDEMSTVYYFIIVTLNILLLVMVASFVINAATSLVVSSRRGALARLGLAGATPRQLVAAMVFQLVLVSAVGSLVGTAVALWAAPSVANALATDPSVPGLTALDVTASPWAILGSVALCVFVGVLGGRAQARAASRVPPVEALRQATGVERPAFSRFRMVLVLAVVALAVVIVVPKPESSMDPSSDLAQGAILVLGLTGVALSVAAPALVGWLTNWWTRLVPTRSASWQLARMAVIAKAARLARTVVPMMFAVGLTFGLLTFGESFEMSLEAAIGQEVPPVSLVSLLSLAGVPIVVALSGAVGNLVMMARARSAELAMGAIVGATPRQLLLVGFFESVIMTVTAALLGVVMTLASLTFCFFALPTLGATLVISVPWGTLGMVTLVCWLAVLVATVLPSASSLLQPPQRVVARLVAD